MSDRKSISISFLVFLMCILIAVESCNNKPENSHTSMKGMDTMTPEKKAVNDELNNNMDGMEMGEHNMEEMNKEEIVSSRLGDSLKISSLVMPSNFRVISSQKSIKAVLNTKINEIKAQGYISIDERRNYKVSARISGRIEKLYIKYDFQRVKVGEKIMEIYSPELNTYQEELIFLLKGNNDVNLIRKAEEKLMLLGVSKSQIDQIKLTGNTISVINVYSPKDGYVFFNALSGKSTMSNSEKAIADRKTNDMGTMANNLKSAVSGNGQIREGNYISKGDVLFWINDLEVVWAMIATDNNGQQNLKTGYSVSLISELHKNDTIKAAINFIEPVYQQNQKFIMSRIYLQNLNKRYKINTLVEANINVGNSSTIIVPYSSVLFLGKRKIVWILIEKSADNNKIYEARDVTIGLTYNGAVEIKKGLNINDEIAIDAGYLIDRESLIKPE